MRTGCPGLNRPSIGPSCLVCTLHTSQNIEMFSLSYSLHYTYVFYSSVSHAPSTCRTPGLSTSLPPMYPMLLWRSNLNILFMCRSVFNVAPVRQQICHYRGQKSTKHLELKMRQISLVTNQSCSNHLRVQIVSQHYTLSISHPPGEPTSLPPIYGKEKREKAPYVVNIFPGFIISNPFA